MKLETRCNCCHSPITVNVDDDYMDLGDPLKLLDAAVCNSCHDQHERETRIRSTIFDLCFALDRGVKAERAQRIRVLLSEACRKYAEVIAVIQDRDTILYEEAFPQLLYDQPAKCPLILRKYRKDCARTHRGGTGDPPVAAGNLPAASLPYKDH
jgi:hypothetical protein